VKRVIHCLLFTLSTPVLSAPPDEALDVAGTTSDFVHLRTTYAELGNGRPANFYFTVSAIDDKLCSDVGSSLNEPYMVDWGQNRPLDHLSDTLLHTAFSLDWIEKSFSYSYEEGKVVASPDPLKISVDPATGKGFVRVLGRLSSNPVHGLYPVDNPALLLASSSISAGQFREIAGGIENGNRLFESEDYFPSLRDMARNGRGVVDQQFNSSTYFFEILSYGGSTYLLLTAAYFTSNRSIDTFVVDVPAEHRPDDLNVRCHFRSNYLIL
jgi:hypothetical protein